MAGLEKIVTDDLVFEVADRLDAEGRKVSNRVIWDQIGGGSMTTIAAALRRWRERQQLKTEQAPERPPLPEAIAETMRDAVDRLWKAAQEETQKEIDRLTQAMNERVAEAAAERDGALAELQAAAQDLQGAQARCSALEAEAAAASQQAEALRAELEAATKQAEIATSRAVEIERRADDLNAELGRVHAQSQAERQETLAAREKAAHLQGQVEAMTKQQAELMRALAGSREDAKVDPARKPPKAGA